MLERVLMLSGADRVSSLWRVMAPVLDDFNHIRNAPLHLSHLHAML